MQDLLVVYGFLRYNRDMGNIASTVTMERCEYENLLAVKTKVTELEMLVKYYEHQLLSAKRRQFGCRVSKWTHIPAR